MSELFAHATEANGISEEAVLNQFNYAIDIINGEAEIKYISVDNAIDSLVGIVEFMRELEQINE